MAKRERKARPSTMSLPSSDEIKAARLNLRKLMRAGRGGVEALRAKYDALRAEHREVKSELKAARRDGARAAKLVASFIAQTMKAPAPAAPVEAK